MYAARCHSETVLKCPPCELFVCFSFIQFSFLFFIYLFQKKKKKSGDYFFYSQHIVTMLDFKNGGVNISIPNAQIIFPPLFDEQLEHVSFFFFFLLFLLFVLIYSHPK